MSISKDYLAGFNSGYTIRKNHPLLMKKILNGAKINGDFFKGLKAGSIEYENEIDAKMRVQLKPTNRSRGRGL